MLDARDTFLIDATGFLEAGQKSFLGAFLLLVDGEDHTFLFGVLRDLLQLRRNLGINRGVFVVGEEGYQVATGANIAKTVSFLKQLGMAVVHDSHVRVLDLCVGLASLVSHVVTRDRNLLQLAKDPCRVIFLNDKDGIEVFTSESVVSRFGVTPDSIPGFMALTSGPAQTLLTKREAIAVLQQPGDLAGKIADPSVFSSRKIRNTLKANGAVILRRVNQFSPSGCCPCLDVARKELEFDIDNDDNYRLLAAHRFYSLRRLLPKPTKGRVFEGQIDQSPRNYRVITTAADLQKVVTELG